jgi:peroxin-12
VGYVIHFRWGLNYIASANCDLCNLLLGASFAENFYGLKRVATQAAINGQFIAPASDQFNQKLSTKDINRSLLFLVGLPYIKCKLDLLYSQVSGGASASLLGENEQEARELEILSDSSASVRTKAVVHLKRIFRKVYPVVNMLYYGSNLCYNIGYLFGKTKYYTPWLRILGIEVKRMSMDDYVSICPQLIPT